ncbi:MAG TPA: methyltransferase [Chthonomonadales bacterium]|nr:methyltransferase [Chthonomonadales bacterium]
MDKSDPTPIFQLATGYWASAALLGANEIGLFGALADGAKTARQIAEALGSDLRATEMLLNACAGLDLVLKQGDAYALTPVADAFLVPGRPSYLGSALRWAQDQYTAWGELPTSVRNGRPAVDPGRHLGGDPQQTRRFVLAMHERAQGVARGVVPFFKLEGCRMLLDVGGGPGTYAVLLAQQYPALHTTVLDLPEVVAIAQELIAQVGLSERVTVRVGDATQADYGEAQYDAVLFSGVLHQMSVATIRRMFAGAHRALLVGGRVIVSDIMLDATKTQPSFAALFSLQMLLTTHEGGVFSAAECAGWLEAAGFEEVWTQHLPPPLPYTIITGSKSQV